jgi:cbb3-type cytochrome oxidase subunit 3
MFRQFTENITANQGYLLFSLAIFFVFFVVVTIMLMKMKKNHVTHMRDMPLHDSFCDTSITTSYDKL